MLPAGQVRIGRYLVGKRIALGGMGEVRLALQQALGEFERPVALKLLLPHLAADPTFVRMFLDEARLVSRMNHPNIVQIFDVGRDGETYFIAMELVEGVSLATLIRRLAEREQQLPPEALVYVGHALCDALAYAHEQKDPQGHSLGLVHRDVTPHNVLVSQTGVVKLTDFGIAKARESGTRTQTETGVVKGKLAFLAPEQIEGTDVDHRADVFGAAVTLFQLATGESPFVRDTDFATMNAVRTEPLPSVRTLRPELTADFDAALLRAADKRADARFTSMRELRAALGPESSRAASELLGALVREITPEPAFSFDSVTEVSRHGSTEDLRPGTETTPHAPSPRWRRRALGAAALAVLLAAGSVAVSHRHVAPMPASTPAPVPVVDRVVTAPASPPREPSPPPSVVATPARVPPRPAERPSATARTGFLSVGASPWANVQVNGRSIGETPIARQSVPAGKLTVVLDNPETHRHVVKTVVVRPGAETRVKADLE